MHTIISEFTVYNHERSKKAIRLKLKYCLFAVYRPTLENPPDCENFIALKLKKFFLILLLTRSGTLGPFRKWFKVWVNYAFQVRFFLASRQAFMWPFNDKAHENCLQVSMKSWRSTLSCRLVSILRQITKYEITLFW